MKSVSGTVTGHCDTDIDGHVDGGGVGDLGIGGKLDCSCSSPFSSISSLLLWLEMDPNLGGEHAALVPPYPGGFGGIFVAETSPSLRWE